jgi:hypothetical protein
MLDPETHARAAANLLREPVLIDALDELERQATDAWAATKLGDTDKREIAWHTLKASHRLKAYLNALVDNGKVIAARATVQHALR